MDTFLRCFGFFALLGLCYCDSPGGQGANLDAAETAAASPDTSDSAAAETTATLPDTSEPDVAQAGPDTPSVRCRSDLECSGGQVCCTLANAYLSDCVDAAECHQGLRDACLTDAQCQTRRPGEWSVCCHDLRDCNYCAPIAETCQPLVPCVTPADCAGNGNDVCCSPHPYYAVSMCTSTFFALPERDCP